MKLTAPAPEYSAGGVLVTTWNWSTASTLDALRDETVVALLVDGLGGHAVEIELAEIVAGAADDGQARAPACAPGASEAKAVAIALRVVHLQRQVGVGLVLHDQADGGVGGIEHRRRGGDDDGLGGLADGQDRIEAQDAESVDVTGCPA